MLALVFAVLVAVHAPAPPDTALDDLPVPPVRHARSDAAPPATAPPDTARYVLAPIPVAAPRLSAVADGLPVSASFLERAALARTGVLRVADALAGVPGVRVARFGAPGSMSAISVRGVTNEQVLVLLDGRRLNPAQGGGVDLGQVDVVALERVEVVRGGASALYGASALGGVINLVSRPPAAAAGGRTTVRLEGGSFGTAAGALAHERTLGGASRLWLSAHGLRTAGDYAYADRGAESARENAFVRAAGAALGYRRGQKSGSGFTADGSVTGGEQGIAGTIEFPTPAARREDRQAQVAAELVRGDRRAWLTLAAHAGRQRRSYTDPDHEIADRHTNRVFGLGLRWDRRLAAGGGEGSAPAGIAEHDRDRLTAGIELDRAALESTTDGDRLRHAAALFARGELVRGRWALAPAARLDVATEHAPIVSPRLAFVLALPGAGELRAAAGRAYRPPSFDDLFAADRGASVGNPALAPERATEIELGLARTFALAGGAGGGAARARLAASAFHQEIVDLIQWTPGPDGRWRPHNVSRAVLRGLELEGGMPFAVRGLVRPAELDLAVTFLDARDRSGDLQTGGRTLPYRARVEGRADLAVPAGAATRLLVSWRGVGRSFITAANTKSLPGYGLLDLTVEHVLVRRITASLAVLNAGGVAAVDVRDYPLPGREWRVAVRAEAPEVFR